MKHSSLFMLMAAPLTLLLAGPMAVAAKDLGVRGRTWAIVEPDLLQQIEARLAGMKHSGELARRERDAAARARELMEQPQPVAGIVPARQRHTRLFDPAVVLGQDIRGPDGVLIAAAGTRINPLARMAASHNDLKSRAVTHAGLSRDLLFIDGRRAVEVAWALDRPPPNTIILLAGRPLDLSRAHGRPFHFDQGGRLVARFGLSATPSLITRDGAHLRITEIPLQENDWDRDRAVTTRDAQP